MKAISSDPSMCADSGTVTVGTFTVVTVGVGSLASNPAGIDIGGETNLYCLFSNEVIAVTATPYPNIPTNTLPNCWTMTGGQYSNIVTRRISRDNPAIITVVARAGTSAKTNTLIVTKVEFKESASCSGFDDDGISIMVPKDAYNTAIAEINPASIANHVAFVSINTGKATVLPATASTTPQTIIVSGISKGDTEVQARPYGAIPSCDWLKVFVKQRINKTIAIHAITEENDDFQTIPFGQGQPNQVCITAGADGILNTSVAGDDVIFRVTIITGPNGICETTAQGDDVQVITPMNGKPNATCVAKGSNGFRDTEEPFGDDLVNASGDIDAGPNGICETTAKSSNDLVPTAVPDTAALQAYLNDQIWGKQANVYFTVTRTDATVNYDLDWNQKLAWPPDDSTEQDAISAAAKDSSVDFNIYYVLAVDHPIAWTRIDRHEAWSAAGGNYVLNTTAHEVGHLLGIDYHSNDIRDVMLEHWDPSNPCRVTHFDWSRVNP